MEAFVKKALDTFAPYPNVIYQDGNEAFTCSGYEFGAGLADLVHARGKLIGTNTDNPGVPADFMELHSCSAPAPQDVPVMVNEFSSECGDHLSADRWKEQAIRAARSGVSFHLWRGQMPDEEFNQALRQLGAVRAEAR
jgi:hypothetical protein